MKADAAGSLNLLVGCKFDEIKVASLTNQTADIWRNHQTICWFSLFYDEPRYPWGRLDCKSKSQFCGQQSGDSVGDERSVEIALLVGMRMKRGREGRATGNG